MIARAYLRTRSIKLVRTIADPPKVPTTCGGQRRDPDSASDLAHSASLRGAAQGDSAQVTAADVKLANPYLTLGWLSGIMVAAVCQTLSLPQHNPDSKLEYAVTALCKRRITMIEIHGIMNAIRWRKVKTTYLPLRGSGSGRRKNRQYLTKSLAEPRLTA